MTASFLKKLMICLLVLEMQNRKSYPKKPTERLTCVYCSKIIAVFPYEIKSGRRFCSSKCHYAARPSGKIIQNCLFCGELFAARLWDIKTNDGGKYCSLKCFHGNYSKEKHHNWKGGITAQSDILRKSAKMKEWKRVVFQRDSFTCQICYQRGKRLHAHHKKPFSLYPNLRFDIDNGQTVCETCHLKIHSGNNRPEFHDPIYHSNEQNSSKSE